MHTTRVVMKDGCVFEGALWTFRPEEGWIGLIGDDAGPAQIWLRDVQSAVTFGRRVRANPDGTAKIADEDELERARQRGWDGR